MTTFLPSRQNKNQVGTLVSEQRIRSHTYKIYAGLDVAPDH